MGAKNKLKIQRKTVEVWGEALSHISPLAHLKNQEIEEMTQRVSGMLEVYYGKNEKNEE